MTDAHGDLPEHFPFDDAPAYFGFPENEYDLDPNLDCTPKQVTYSKEERVYIQRHLAFVESLIKKEVADPGRAHLLSKTRALRRDMHKLSDQRLYYALDGYMM